MEYSKINIDEDCLPAMKLFESCSLELKSEIAKASKKREYKPGELLIEEGAIPNGIFYLLEGTVKLSKMSGSGERIMMLCGSGDIPGICSWVTAQPYQFTARAISEAVVCVIPGTTVELALKNTPSLFFQILKKLDKMTIELENRATLLMANSAERIVIDTMKDLKEKFGTDISGYLNLTLPVKELANYVCISKTNLYRVLDELRQRKLIRYEGDRYMFSESR